MRWKKCLSIYLIRMEYNSSVSGDHWQSQARLPAADSGKWARAKTKPDRAAQTEPLKNRGSLSKARKLYKSPKTLSPYNERVYEMGKPDNLRASFDHEVGFTSYSALAANADQWTWRLGRIWHHSAVSAGDSTLRTRVNPRLRQPYTMQLAQPCRGEITAWNDEMVRCLRGEK